MVVQKRVMETLRQLQEELDAALLLVGHDMGLMAQCVDRIGVMYAGRLVEEGGVDEVLKSPLHPYTQLLVASLPSCRGKGRVPRHPRTAPLPDRPAQAVPVSPPLPRGDGPLRYRAPSLEAPVPPSQNRRVACHLHAPASP